MKVTMLGGIHDGDPGATANDIIYKTTFLFSGADVPNGPVIGMGPDGSGVRLPSINLNTVTAAIFSNAVEDAAIAEAQRLGLPVPARTDVFFVPYTRGS